MMTESDIEAILAEIESDGLSESLIVTVRQRYPDFHFTYCMDDDMDAHTPARVCRGFNVYYVNSTDHCATLTANLEQASGLVFAEVIDEDWA